MNFFGKHSTSGRKKIWIIGLISSAIFGYFAFRNFQWNTLLHVILTINLWLLLLSGVILMLSFNLRAYRWKFFLPLESNFSFSSRLSAVAIGYVFSNILPGRLGDFVRPGYLAKANNQCYHICLYSIIIERVWELVLFLIFSLFILKLSSIETMKKLPVNLLLIIFFIIFGLLFLFFAKLILNFLIRILERVKLRLIAHSINDILTAFEDNLKLHHIIFLIALTAGIFFLDGLFFVFIIDSFELPINFFDGFIVMIITALSNFLPSAPANIGVFHYFSQLSITMFGIQKEVALSVAILIHAFIYIFDFIFALLCLFFEKFLKSKNTLRKTYAPKL